MVIKGFCFFELFNYDNLLFFGIYFLRSEIEKKKMLLFKWSLYKIFKNGLEVYFILYIILKLEYLKMYEVYLEVIV